MIHDMTMLSSRSATMYMPACSRTQKALVQDLSRLHTDPSLVAHCTLYRSPPPCQHHVASLYTTPTPNPTPSVTRLLYTTPTPNPTPSVTLLLLYT